MSNKQNKVLVVATSRKTHGGIASVIKAMETGRQWKKYHCRWIETHRFGGWLTKIFYVFIALIQFSALLPFYNIVHIHPATIKSARRKYIFFLLARLFRKRIIIQLHCGDQIQRQWSFIYRDMITKSDIVLVLSKSVKRTIENIIGEQNNIRVLYNPCPVIKNPPATKTTTVLFVGTILEHKGYHDLLRAFARIAAQYPDWKVTLAGQGEIKRGQILAKQLNINTQVEFSGWVEGETKEELFRTATIFCFPSYEEGFPMAVLEALAYGLPVITTPVGGLPDILSDGRNAMIFNPGDIEHLATLLQQLIENESARASLSAESKKLARTVFSVDTIVAQLDEIYATVSQ
ncbi:MAG: glycosyltransferase family 4 protein [Dysgonamonadaceae bacterium]|jgi:glycosyltransferase involved in cell wall biosynthesis|nr:glycosyltransferase family 4 protein [Dysgonamonadaceae bacterium]